MLLNDIKVFQDKICLRFKRKGVYPSHSQKLAWKLSFNGKAHFIINLDSMTLWYFGIGR